MLEYLRNAADKPVAKILIGLLAFSFVGWGVAEWIFGSVAGDTTLVKVGDAEISMQQFNVEKSRQLAGMTREQQRVLYADPVSVQALNDKVLSTLTTQAMAENRADDLGFVVTEARIAKEIREFPEFQSEGKFSTLLFDIVLSNTGYTEADFAEFLRNQILRAYVLGSMSVPVPVPDFAVVASYNSRYGQREIEYSTVDFSDFKVANPTDEQLKDFYAKKPHIIPEQRTVSYVIVSADMDKPDSYDEGYEKAIRVEDDIIAGEAMSVAANKNKAKYVSLGTFDKDSRPVDAVLTDQMVAKIFDMDEGLESEIIETKKGFVIVRVDKIIPSHNAEFESVKNSLVSDWKKEEQRKQAYVRANELLVDLNQKGELQNKKNSTVSRASGAPVEVLASAFNSAVGTNSIVSGSDAFYVLHIEKEIEPKPDSKKMETLRKELQNMSLREITDDYNSFLIREYPVKVNEKVFNRFFNK